MKVNKQKLVRYLLVGGTAYGVEISCLYFFVHALNLSSLRAVAISFWIGFVVAFILQKLITFKNYDKQTTTITKQLIGYGLLVAWNYGFTLIMVKLLSRHGSIIMIRTFVILIVTSWNFIFYQMIFKEQPKPIKTH